jgi:hypothetical protein
MAPKTIAGKFGGFWQVNADDARLMTSQVVMPGKFPLQMSSLEKPLCKIIVFKVQYITVGKVSVWKDHFGLRENQVLSLPDKLVSLST